MGGCIWLAFNYASSTDSEAKKYAEEVVQKLAVQHDPNFLARNLSEKGKMDVGIIRQQEITENFRRMGVPRGPLKTTGKIIYESKEGPKEPVGRFQTELRYAAAKGRFFLEVARRHARWEIDGLYVQWQFPQTPTPAPAAIASPTPTETPGPTIAPQP